MTKPSFTHLLHRETDDLIGDPWLLSLATWIPPLLFLTMWWIFSQGVATELPIGVVDLDKSRTSRALIRHFEASPTLKIDDSFLEIAQASSALKSGYIYGLVVLPQGLEEQALRGRPPQITAFTNSQFLLTQKMIDSALLQAHGTYTAKVETVRNLASATPVYDMALSAALPISSQTVPLFNIGKNYAQFLVSAIIPGLWQIVMVTGAVLSLALVHRKYTLKGWLGETPVRALLVKMVHLSTIFWLHGILFLTFMYVWLGWPMHGDWSLLFASQFVTACASTGVGCLIFFLIRDVARSLSIAAAYVAPALAFMGVTFPVIAMTLPAQIWRSLIPICHYIEIQFGQVNHGAPMETTIPQFEALGLLLIPGLVVLIMATRLTAPIRTSPVKEAV